MCRFFAVAIGPRFSDHEEGMETGRKMWGMDAVDVVLVLIVHDESLRDGMPLFTEATNGWMAGDLRFGNKVVVL